MLGSLKYLNSPFKKLRIYEEKKYFLINQTGVSGRKQTISQGTKGRSIPIQSGTHKPIEKEDDLSRNVCVFDVVTNQKLLSVLTTGCPNKHGN